MNDNKKQEKVAFHIRMEKNEYKNILTKYEEFKEQSGLKISLNSFLVFILNKDKQNENKRTNGQNDKTNKRTRTTN